MQDLIEKAKELERKYVKRRKKPNVPEKGPRHYAADILALPKSQQAEALRKVPEHLYTWVSEYVNDPHAEQRIVNSVAASIAKLSSRENRVAALEKVPELFRERVKAAATQIIKNRRAT